MHQAITCQKLECHGGRQYLPQNFTGNPVSKPATLQVMRLAQQNIVGLARCGIDRSVAFGAAYKILIWVIENPDLYFNTNFKSTQTLLTFNSFPFLHFRSSDNSWVTGYLSWFIYSTIQNMLDKFLAAVQKVTLLSKFWKSV